MNLDYSHHYEYDHLQLISVTVIILYLTFELIKELLKLAGLHWLCFVKKLSSENMSYSHVL